MVQLVGKENLPRSCFLGQLYLYCSRRHSLFCKFVSWLHYISVIQVWFRLEHMFGYSLHSPFCFIQTLLLIQLSIHIEFQSSEELYFYFALQIPDTVCTGFPSKRAVRFTVQDQPCLGLFFWSKANLEQRNWHRRFPLIEISGPVFFVLADQCFWISIDWPQT